MISPCSDLLLLFLFPPLPMHLVGVLLLPALSAATLFPASCVLSASDFFSAHNRALHAYDKLQLPLLSL